MGVSKYTARRRKRSWTTHTKTGKPVMAHSRKEQWGVTRVTTPRLPREVKAWKTRQAEIERLSDAYQKENSLRELEAIRNEFERVGADEPVDVEYTAVLRAIRRKKKGIKPIGNPAEIRGQQLRIRVLKPKKKARYRVHDVGRRGKLQLTLMDGQVQSYVLNLKDYPSKDHVLFEIGQLRLTPAQKAEAVSLVNKHWRGKK